MLLHNLLIDLVQIIARAPAFHPKAPEDVAMMISLQGLRPSFKTKIKSCPLDLKEVSVFPKLSIGYSYWSLALLHWLLNSLFYFLPMHIVHVLYCQAYFRLSFFRWHSQFPSPLTLFPSLLNSRMWPNPPSNLIYIYKNIRLPALSFWRVESNGDSMWMCRRTW